MPNLLCPFAAAAVMFLSTSVRGELRVGAAIVDVMPTSFPVLVNGSMTSRTADRVNTNTPISARAIVLDDGRERIGIVVVDSCMMGRELLDEAKQQATQRTQLKHDRILISATHTHTAPSSFGALGTDAQADYVPVLRAGIAESLAKAEANLEPARVGIGIADAAEYTALRRWIRRPDRIALDPFGNPTVRANMHAGQNWDDVTGESGPEDPDLAVISFESPEGSPIAVIANFSMHYFSAPAPLDFDYFGRFCNNLQQHVGEPVEDHSPFVAIMSHGCSGDIWRRDYKKPTNEQQPYGDIEQYASELADIALRAMESIEYLEYADLAIAERRMKLRYRVPDQQRLDWARRIVAEMGDRLPQTTREVYAREQLILHERQETEIVVQALRIGDIGIATTPNETYALTGLKLKLQSPLADRTIVIELANGGDGYIPPPEQHVLGGYNTWPARSAGLEVEAEPKITETALQLLEEVADRPRRIFVQSRGPMCDRFVALNPVAWYRFDEMSGPIAVDSTQHRHHGTYGPAVAYFLDGPDSDLYCRDGETNRCAHFSGSHLAARLDAVGAAWSVSFSFWNGMPADAREVTGWMFSRDRSHEVSRGGCHLGIGGTATNPGKLILLCGSESRRPLVGKTAIERWTWNRVTLTRQGSSIRVFLNGGLEIVSDSVSANSPVIPRFFFGGRSDNRDNWEGRIDEAVVFDRALSDEEAWLISGG